MGSEALDYIITDKIISPMEHAQFYDEKLVCLPHCYQATDRNQPLPKTPGSRKELGLPEDKFIFCNFKNSLFGKVDDFFPRANRFGRLYHLLSFGFLIKFL